MTHPDRLSEQLAQRLAEHSTIPVPVETIVANQGWVIGREAHNDQRALCSGFAVQQDDYRIIGVNRRISPRRQRYAIAHSLGHGLLHLSQTRPLILCYSLVLDRPAASRFHATPAEEEQARNFAMDLLMPETQLLAALSSEAPHATSRDQLIERLAKQFEVSSEAMGFRLIDLGVAAA